MVGMGQVVVCRRHDGQLLAWRFWTVWRLAAGQVGGVTDSGKTRGRRETSGGVEEVSA
jgi:hypothetical protein